MSRSAQKRIGVAVNDYGDGRMGQGSIDRRAARTRAKLHQSLASLIQQEDYDAITVEDICAVADVARSTFYAHYAGKDDLKRSGLEQLRSKLLEQQLAGSTGQVEIPRFSLAMFRHARDHIDHYRALSGNRGGALALGVIRQILSELFRNELATEEMNPGEHLPRELVIEYVIGAYMAVLIRWLDGGAKLPPESVDAMFRRLTIRGLASFRL
jgi:AcrR family transcriptional regulator